MLTKKIFFKLLGKKALSDFFGALSEKSADALEKSIAERRKIHNKLVLTKNKNFIRELIIGYKSNAKEDLKLVKEWDGVSTKMEN